MGKLLVELWILQSLIIKDLPKNPNGLGCSFLQQKAKFHIHTLFFVFLELKARGKFSSKDITDALTSSQGDVELAYAKLTKSTSKPFLMRIWGAGEGAQNKDGALPKQTESIRNHIETYSKDVPDIDDVQSDELWDEEEEDVEWDEDYDEQDDEEEHEDIDLQTCRDDMYIPTDVTTPDSDRSDYLDAFGSNANTLERNVSSPGSDTFFVIPDTKETRKSNGLLSKLAALRKDSKDSKQSNTKFYDEEAGALSDSQSYIEDEEQQKTYNPISMIKNTIYAIRDSVNGTSKSEKKVPCTSPEKRTIIVSGQIAHESLNDDNKHKTVKPIVTKSTTEDLTSEADNFAKQSGARPKQIITKETLGSNEKDDKVNATQEAQLKLVEIQNISNLEQSEPNLKVEQKSSIKNVVRDKSPSSEINKSTNADRDELNVKVEQKNSVKNISNDKSPSSEATKTIVRDVVDNKIKITPVSEGNELNLKAEQKHSVTDVVRDKSPSLETTKTTVRDVIGDKLLKAETASETKPETSRTVNSEADKKSPSLKTAEGISINKAVDKHQSLPSTDKQHAKADHTKNEELPMIDSEEDKSSLDLPEHPPVFSSVKSNDKSLVKNEEHNKQDKKELTSSTKDFKITAVENRLNSEVKVNENLKKECSMKLGEVDNGDLVREVKEASNRTSNVTISENKSRSFSNKDNTTNAKNHHELKDTIKAEIIGKDNQNTKLPVIGDLQHQLTSNAEKNSVELQEGQTKQSKPLSLKESIDQNLEGENKKSLHTQDSSKTSTDTNILKEPRKEESETTLNKSSNEAVSEIVQESEDSSVLKTAPEHEQINIGTESSSETDKNKLPSVKGTISPSKERKTPVKDLRPDSVEETKVSSDNAENKLSEPKLRDVNVETPKDKRSEIVAGPSEPNKQTADPIINDSAAQLPVSGEIHDSTISSDLSFEKSEKIPKSLEDGNNVSNSSTKRVNEIKSISESIDTNSKETSKPIVHLVQTDNGTTDKITSITSNVSEFDASVNSSESTNSSKAVENNKSATRNEQPSLSLESVSSKKEQDSTEKLKKPVSNIPQEIKITPEPLEYDHISNNEKPFLDRVENDIKVIESNSAIPNIPVEPLSSSEHSSPVNKEKEVSNLEMQSVPKPETSSFSSPGTSVTSLAETSLSSSLNKTNLETSAATSNLKTAEAIDPSTNKTIPSDVVNASSSDVELKKPKVSESSVTDVTNSSQLSGKRENLAVDESVPSTEDAIAIPSTNKNEQGTSKITETVGVVETNSSATSLTKVTEQASSSNTTPQSNTTLTSNLKSETASKKHSRVTFQDEKEATNVSAEDISSRPSDSKTSESHPVPSSSKSETVSDSEASSDDSDPGEEIELPENIRKGSLTYPSPVEALRSRFEGLAEDNHSGVIRPQSPYRRMSFRSTKAAIALERTRDTSVEKPWYQSKTTTEQKKAPPKRSIKQQLEVDRKVRKMVADRKVRTYRKAEIVVQLMDMNFEEEEAVQAANECSTLEQAISFLQQECLLCAGHFPVSHMVSMVHCPHKACRECIRAYFTVQIRDRNIMELLCPFCNEPDIFDEDIAQDYFNHLDIMLKKLVDSEIHELFQRKLRDRVLMRDPNFRWCSQCSSGFIAMENLKRLVCPDCNAVMCASCRRPWEKEHQGISCEAFAALKDANDTEAQATGLAKLLIEDGIDCPMCHFRYALAKGGCMHFRCTQCQHDFCSGCSKPFKMGQKCGVSDFCGKLGLHAHHPRNCLFYLRDKDPEDLQKLLDLSGVKYNRDPPEGMDVKKTCQVMEQKETSDGLVDDCCGKEVEENFAGLCRIHYVEYLGQLVNKHKVDPIQIFEVDDLELVLRRVNLRLPSRRYRENDVQYSERLIKIIQDELPLDDMDGS
ncbi:e3 ubiquitin-protein ligase RNF31 [Trichonephila clavipes]|nr:e3 ubiquitin-protein ligase RNF31 [Trichonephila clavipes]